MNLSSMNASFIFVMLLLLLLMTLHSGVKSNKSTSSNLRALKVAVVTPTSSATRDECENSNSFGYEGDDTRTCDAYVAEKPKKRCKKKQPGTGKKVNFFCPATCKRKCRSPSPSDTPTDDRGPCENSNSFGYKGDDTRTCDAYVAKNPKKRCKKKQPGTGKKVNFFCPATCKRKCRSPSPSPTDTPTDSPTDRGPCQNSFDFGFNGDATQTCDVYVAKKPKKRCSKEQPGTGKQVKYFCPATCKGRCKNTDASSATPSSKPSELLSVSTDKPTPAASTDTPTASSSIPSCGPTVIPSGVPSSIPSLSPSAVPSLDPSAAPSVDPSASPSSVPGLNPSGAPSAVPSFVPSTAPSSRPSFMPSLLPSSLPSLEPSFDPSGAPSSFPSSVPSSNPSGEPSNYISSEPSSLLSSIPSFIPSGLPSYGPSFDPSGAPSAAPSVVPSTAPSSRPSFMPSLSPSSLPSLEPSFDPSGAPTSFPSPVPSSIPSSNQSGEPSNFPSSEPSSLPSSIPSSGPSLSSAPSTSSAPSDRPSNAPSLNPSKTATVLQKLIADDLSAGDRFGWVVAISENTAIVGAFFQHEGSNADVGAAYIFQKSSGQWTQTQKLTAPDGSANDWFGYSVSISSNTAIVGAYNNGAGSAYIYQFANDQWEFVQTLTAGDGDTGDFFGIDVDISGDMVIVGASKNNNQGAAYIFEKDLNGWTEIQKFTSTDGGVDRRFDSAVSISGNVAIVGSNRADIIGIDSGAAHIFERNIDDTWTTTVISSHDLAVSDRYGLSVSISGETAIIGTRATVQGVVGTGSAYIFSKNTDGNWVEIQKLTASDALSNDYFGTSVSISGDNLIVGAPNTDDRGGDSGSAYLFERMNNGVWTVVEKITTSELTSGDLVGYSVGISGENTIMGAPFDNSKSGSVYFN